MVEVGLEVDTNECIEWDGSLLPKFYGIVCIDGENKYIHRVVWEEINGPIPEGKHVLHRCDNPPCLNVEHLFLGSNQDNIRDKVAKGRSYRGERHAWSKLKEDDVLSIRNLLTSGKTCQEISGLFGVTRSLVSEIKNGRCWKHLGGPIRVASKHRSRGEAHWKARLTVDDVKKIRRMLATGTAVVEIATMFGVSKTAIQHIKYGKNWRHVQ